MNHTLTPSLDGFIPRCLRGGAFGSLLGLLLFALAGAPALHAQATGSISGRVFNPSTSEYVRDAEVSIAGTNLAVQTEGNGYYRLVNVPPGEVTLRISYPGYNPIAEKLTITAGAVAVRDFEITALGTASRPDEPVKLEKYVVTSTLQGNAKAIAEQKAAMNVKTVVSADNFGEIAEGNIGEFLKFLPGVVLDYVETDTRAARMGGLEAGYGSVTLNGSSFANAGGNNRQFEFEAMSINNIESIEINKTLSADMPANAPAGNVNLRTKSPLDRKGQSFNFTTAIIGNQYEHSLTPTARPDDSEHRKSRPTFVFDYNSGALLDGKFAVNISAASTSVFKLQYRESLSYDYTSATAQARQAPLITAITYKDGPKITDKNSISLAAAYRPFSPQLTFNLVAGYTGFSDAINNRNLAWAVNAAQNAPGSTLTHIVANPVASANTNVNQSGGTGNKREDTRNLLVNGIYQGSRITLDATVAYSTVMLQNGNETLGAVDRANLRLSRISWTADRPSVDSPSWSFTQTSGPDWNNLDSYGTADVQASNIVTDRTKTKTQQFNEFANLKYVLPWTLPSFLKTGIYHQVLTRDASRKAQSTYTWVGPTGNQLTSPMPASIARFDISPAFGGNITSLPVPDKTALYQMLTSNPGYFTQTEANRATDLDAFFSGNQDVQEEVFAGYLMGNTRLGKLSIQAGVRYEGTETMSQTYRRVPDAENPFPANTINRIVYRWSNGRQTLTGRYADVLPSAALVYKFTPNLSLKLGYHKAIKRPDLDRLAGQWAINEAAQTVDLPSPNLKPERSDKLSLMLEYYFEPASTASVHVFQTHIKNSADRTGFLPASEFGFGDDPIYGDYLFRGWRNIPGTRTVRGVEFNYNQQLVFLPGPLRGTSVFATYSVYTTDPDPSDFVRNVVTAGINYRYRNFSAKIAGTHTPDIWTGDNIVSATNNTYFFPGDKEYKKERYIVDIDASYRFTKHLTVFASVRNAFNSGNTWYYPDSDGRIRQMEKYGGQWTLGLKGNF